MSTYIRDVDFCREIFLVNLRFRQRTKNQIPLKKSIFLCVGYQLDKNRNCNYRCHKLNPFHIRKRDIKETKIMSDTHWNPFNLRTTTNVFVLPRFTKHFVSSALWSSSLIFFHSSVRAFCFFIFFATLILWCCESLVILSLMFVCVAAAASCFSFEKNPGKNFGKILEILILEMSWKNPGKGFVQDFRPLLFGGFRFPFVPFFALLAFFLFFSIFAV